MDELTLWNQLRAGKKSALEAIYREQVDALFRYGCKFSPNESTVKDCIQELFIELWKNHKGLGATNSVKKYLLASLRRKIIKVQGKQKRWLLKDQSNDTDFDLELAPEEQMINEEISAEQQEMIQKALASLSKRQKEAVYLKYYADLDYEEICEVMDISYQSIRNLMVKAIKKMRDSLGSTLFIIFFMKNWPEIGYKITM